MISSIYNKLTPFKNSSKIIIHDQNVSDIITGMLNAHDKYKSEYDKISNSFAGRNVKTTARNLWQFLKNNVNYVVESDDKQMLKSPSAILYTGKTTGSDCKNFSLFIGGTLASLQRKGFPIDWAYRFASYRLMDKLPHHVFVVINPGTKNEIWIDPVLNGFDQKKQYYYKIDKKPKNMSLIALSGIDGIGRKTKKTAPKKTSAKKTAKQTKRKQAIKKIATKLKKTGKGILKIALTPSRNAFLLLVKLNFKGIATNLKKVYAKNPDKLKTFWSGFNGKWDNLISNINIGSNKKPLEDLSSMIGIPNPLKATTITASPILLKLSNFFAELGIDTEELKDISQNALNESAQNVVDKVTNQAKQIESEEKEEVKQAKKELNTESSEEETPGLSKNTMLLIGAGAVGLFLLTRKK